ncbi:MAG: hypothetical protein AVDCRST_MAG69-583, partial [uncultured Solirubrobacteraceae bacterium]
EPVAGTGGSVVAAAMDPCSRAPAAYGLRCDRQPAADDIARRRDRSPAHAGRLVAPGRRPAHRRSHHRDRRRPAVRRDHRVLLPRLLRRRGDRDRVGRPRPPAGRCVRLDRGHALRAGHDGADQRADPGAHGDRHPCRSRRWAPDHLRLRAGARGGGQGAAVRRPGQHHRGDRQSARLPVAALGRPEPRVARLPRGHANRSGL